MNTIITEEYCYRCCLETEQKYGLNVWARKQPISSKWLSIDLPTFSFCVKQLKSVNKTGSMGFGTPH